MTSAVEEKGEPMARYIDAKEAYDVLTQNYNHKTEIQHIMLESVLNKVHTADVRENRRGHWTIKTINTFSLNYGSTGYEPVYECSVCGMFEESYFRLDEPIMPEDASFPNFCPNCGADMREADDGSLH